MATLMALALPILCLGCHRAPQLARVSGTVTFQGKPVAEAVVIFNSAQSGRSITASVSSAGEYRVETANGFGLPLGTYRVHVIPQAVGILPDQRPPFPLPKMRSDIPARFRDTKTSGLAVDVVAGENRFDIAM